MNILICVAGMPYSVPTVQFGGLVARLTGANVVILNVEGVEAQSAAGESTLATAHDMLGDLDAQTKTTHGAPGPEILSEARAGGYDLVVVGASDVLSIGELLTGSIARRAVRRLQESVLVVRIGRPALQKMLICTGGRAEDLPVIQMGGALAQAAGAHVTLMHVSGPVPSMYQGLRVMKEELAELLRTDTPVAVHLREGAALLRQQGLRTDLKLRRGTVASEILREADEGDYDLIAVGATRSDRQAGDLLTVDVTRQVVDRALRPVLVVHRKLQSRNLSLRNLWRALVQAGRRE